MNDYLNLKFLLIFTCILCASCSHAGTSSSPEDDSDKTEKEASTEVESEEEESTEIELYSEALRSYDGGRFMISKTFYEKLIQNYPGSPLAQSAELKIGDCLFFSDRYVEAIASYREFARLHSKHEARPYALYQIALSFQKSYQGTKQDQTPLKEAIKQYVSLVNEYPSSSYAKKATSQILEAEEELFTAEIAVIEFYERTDDESAAKKRKTELKKLFGHLPSYKNKFGKVDENTIEMEQPDNLPSPVPTKEMSPEAVASVAIASVPLENPTELVASPTELVSPAPSLILAETPVPSPSPIPSPTIELKILEMPSPVPEAVLNRNSHTLADLENKALESEEENSRLPTVSDKRTFLLSGTCDYEVGVLKIFLRFHSRPFLKSSTNLISNETIINKITFQEGFSTISLPMDADDKEWQNLDVRKCLESDDLEVQIKEKMKDTDSKDSFGPKSYLFVEIISKKPLKISIVNDTKPESLAIIAQ